MAQSTKTIGGKKRQIPETLNTESARQPPKLSGGSYQHRSLVDKRRKVDALLPGHSTSNAGSQNSLQSQVPLHVSDLVENSPTDAACSQLRNPSALEMYWAYIIQQQCCQLHLQDLRGAVATSPAHAPPAWLPISSKSSSSHFQESKPYLVPLSDQLPSRLLESFNTTDKQPVESCDISNLQQSSQAQPTLRVGSTAQNEGASSENRSPYPLRGITKRVLILIDEQRQIPTPMKSSDGNQMSKYVKATLGDIFADVGYPGWPSDGRRSHQKAEDRPPAAPLSSWSDNRQSGHRKK